mgnify:CR=1 FL=1
MLGYNRRAPGEFGCFRAASKSRFLAKLRIYGFEGEGGGEGGRWTRIRESNRRRLARLRRLSFAVKSKYYYEDETYMYARWP